MTRLPILATLLALLLAVVAIWFLVLSDPPGPEPVTDLRLEVERAAPGGADLEAQHIQGGVYAGHVVDPQGAAVHGARVLLISYGTGAADLTTAGQGADDAPIARIGNHQVAGEGITEEDGAFRIAADSQSLITRVLTYHPGFFLDVAEVDRPRNDILLRLQPAGRIIGTVVDDKTGEPVPRAVVDIYLQQKVAPVPESAEAGGYVPFKRGQHKMSWLVTLGRFISKDLGMRIWDVADSGSETLRVYTDMDGRFEFGPIGNSVQLEFVITHARYKWYDFDSDEGKRTPRRTVVEPGQTVERTFRMRHGEHISGQVVDDTGKGLSDVAVKVQSISAYYRHWWYRFKWRHTRTDADGRFRVDGLAGGSQEVVFQHPSFKSKTTSVKAGTEDLIIVADRFGAVSGAVEGLEGAAKGRRITVFFETTEDNPTDERRLRRSVSVDEKNNFLVQRVPPGTYRVWIKAGRIGSEPVEMEIQPLQTVTARFEVGVGGTILARVMDADGGLVDPASARLVRVAGDAERALGTFVTREGVFEIEGVAPGTYRLEVSAPGRVTARSESFDVSRDRTTQLSAITLTSWSYLRFGQPMNEAGRPAKIVGEFVLEFRKGGEPFQRIYNAGVEQAVAPGRYDVRARTADLQYVEQIEVAAGEAKDVAIVLVPKP